MGRPAATVDAMPVITACACRCRYPGPDACPCPCPRTPQALCGALFPTHSRLVLQRLLEAVQRGAERYQAAAIGCMRAIFQVPGLDLGPSAWPASDPGFTQQLSAHLSGPLSGEVLETFRAMLRFQGAAAAASAAGASAATSGGGEAADGSGSEDDGAREAVGPPPAAAAAPAAPLQWPHCMDDLGASNKLCSEALERVMRACPGSAQLLWGSSGGHATSDSFLPFLSDPPA